MSNVSSNPLGVLSSVIPNIPQPAVEIVMALLAIIFRLVQAGGDEAAQEEALMSAPEEAKRIMDKKRFGRPG